MEVVIIIMLLPFGALCIAASMYIYNRDMRERRRQLYDLSQDYDNRWQEFEAQHRGKFEPVSYTHLTLPTNREV